MAPIFFTKDVVKPSLFTTLGLLFLLLTAIALLLAGPVLGTIQQSSSYAETIYSWRLKALLLVQLLLLAGSGLTFMGILHGLVSQRVRIGWRGLTGTILAVTLAFSLWHIEKVEALSPGLHDVTTNLTDPPYFQVLAERSYDASIPALVEGGRLDRTYASNHRQLFPSLAPLKLSTGALKVRLAVKRTVETLGWHLEHTSNSGTYTEAYYTDPWLQLRSNIVIRVRSDAAGGGSVLDIRAVSVLGISDYGVNIRLIRRFLSEMRRQLN